MSNQFHSQNNQDRISELEAERDYLLTKLNKSTKTSTNTSGRDVSDVCYPLPEILQSAPTIWREHWNDILEASLKVIGPLEDFKPWIALLLDHLSPVDLLKSVKSLPDMNHFRSIVKIVQARRNYMLSHESLNTPDAPPKLKILVFGGSVTLVSKSHSFNQYNIAANSYLKYSSSCIFYSNFRAFYATSTQLEHHCECLEDDAHGPFDSNILSTPF